jgi:hypothetical protein
MNWFRENQFLGGFVIALVICTAGAGYFLFSEKGQFDAATARYAEQTSELNRLEQLAPYPNEDNYRKMKAQAEEYGAALNKIKEQLKTRTLPVKPLAPNEFQTRLRQVSTEIADKARVNKVKLPENFYLGFNDFTTTLPPTAAAPLLGQQLDQVTLAVNMLLDAHIDAIVAFRRTPLPEERAAPAATPTPAGMAPRNPAASAQPPAAKLVDHSSIEATFVSTPAASRKVINQLATSQEQFFIVRTLHVRNEKDKGPPREPLADAASAAPAATTPGTGEGKGPAAGANLNFIVGTEKVQTSANIELVKFTFP